MTRNNIPCPAKITSVVSLLLGCLLTPIGAQEHNAVEFRSTTRLVQLNVVVVDHHGRPVGDLSQFDFQLFDNGREQKLIHFSRTSPIRAKLRSASPLVITNRPSGPVEVSGSATVILVDETIEQDIHAIDLNLIATIQGARLQLLNFLASLQPGERVALYAARPQGVVIIHDFTDDPTELVAAAQRLGSGLVTNTASSNNLHRVLAGNWFEVIRHHLQGIPGRKNVVWISTTFPPMVKGLNPDVMAGEQKTILPDPISNLQSPHFANTENDYWQLLAFAHFLSSTNISVYPIDPRGMMTSFALNGGRADQPSRFGPPPPRPASTFDLQNGPWRTMNLVASETGGRAFFDTNGLDQMLRDVLDENRVSYQLGYYPGDSAWDGKYHKVEVKVKGKGLIVRCRRGYFAVDEPVTRDPEAALRDAAESVVEALGIGLTVQVPANPLGWSWQDIVLKIDTHDIRFDHSDGRWNAHLDVAFAQLSQDGRILSGVKDTLAVSLLPQKFQEVAESGWTYTKRVQVDREADRLRVVIRDAVSGAIGSVTVPVRGR